MTDAEDKKQSINIATMGVQIDAILRSQEEIKILIKEEIARTKNSFRKQFEGVEIEANNVRKEQRERIEEHKKHIDDLCSRIKILEKNVLLLEERFIPIKKIWDNLVYATVGFLIMVGGLFVGALYFLKDKIKY